MTTDHHTFGTLFTASPLLVPLVLLVLPSTAAALLEHRRVIGAEARVVGCAAGGGRDDASGVAVDAGRP